MPLIQNLPLQSNASPIGIITDSHGNVSLLKKAIDLLIEKTCTTIIHLGDICDSAHIHTADDCIEIIQKNNIMAIKGNNDHALTVSHDPQISKPTLDYIQSLPLVIQNQHLTFTHSLPFVEQLGLSCMIRDLNDDFCNLYFDTVDSQSILFRGHSHQPELIVKNKYGWVRKMLHYSNQMEIACTTPCVVTCGAVMNYYCMMYWPGPKSFFQPIEVIKE